MARRKLVKLGALRPGGNLRFADIANNNPIAPEAVAQIYLWIRGRSRELVL